MTLTSQSLTQDIKNQIFLQLADIYSLYSFFGDAYKDRLREAINRAVPDELNYRNTKGAVLIYFQPLIASKDQYEIVDLIIKTAYVLIKSYDSNLQFDRSKEAFITKYPELEEIDDYDPEEFKFLHQFTIYLRVALSIIQPNRAKGLLMRIASILEGSQRIYRTGGGQTVQVTNREMIYERETGSKKGTRTKRVHIEIDPNTEDPSDLQISKK